MNMIKNIIALAIIGAISLSVKADDFEELRRKQREEFEQFQQKSRKEYSDYSERIRKEFEEYRAKINAEYAEFLSRPWQAKPILRPINPPVVPEPPTPITIKDDEDKLKPNPKPIEIDTVVTPPTPIPQPEPVVPIIPHPTPKPVVETDKISYYGTSIELPKVDFKNFKYNNDAGAAWDRLCKTDFEDFLNKCLETRKKIGLPDWGYFKLIDKALTSYYPTSTDEHTFIMGFMLIQSGYKIRFAHDVKKLIMLFAIDGVIYGTNFLKIGGEKFYPYNSTIENSIDISEATYKSEKSLSLDIRQSPKLAYSPGNKRVVPVKNYPEITLTSTPNKNLIDFWNDYPNGSTTDSEFTRWAIQGNCPLSDNMKNELYPVLRKQLQGKNQIDAVNLLLKVAQSFPYGYDNEIWGRDRTFWVEESWHYPKSDCEDHAIHFSRLVRDLMGLNAVLIYYPGHLSCAVEITDGTAQGDYVVYNGKRYTVCDATCFYSQAGFTSPSNDNSKAILLLLRK